LLLHEDVVTNAFFAASIHCKVGNRSSTFFWLDLWFNNRCLSDLALELFTVVVLRARKLTMAAALADQTWMQDISAPMTVPVIDQYLHLQQQL
jgi:hypothetical protein